MPAPIKYSTKSASEKSAIADSLFKEILKDLEEQDGDVKSTKLEVFSVGHGIRPFGSNYPDDYIDLTISVNGNKVAGLGEGDVMFIGKELVKKLNAQKSVKGWDSLSVSEKDIFLSYGNFTPDFSFPCEVRSLAKPCKEFDKLNKLLSKHYGKGISQTDLFQVSLFGKRATYDESGVKKYVCFYPEACNKFIESAKKAFKKGNGKSFEVVVTDDIDTTISSRLGTECYGERYAELKFA